MGEHEYDVSWVNSMKEFKLGLTTQVMWFSLINFQVQKTVTALMYLIKIGDLPDNKIKQKDNWVIIEIDSVT